MFVTILLANVTKPATKTENKEQKSLVYPVAEAIQGRTGFGRILASRF